MANLKEIADLAEVSLSTVSRVLNKDETIKISPQVRNKIFDIAHKLNYIPTNQRHIDVRRGFTIGIADWHILRKGAGNVNINDYAGVAKRFCKTPTEFIRVQNGVDVKVDGIIALGEFSDSEIAFLNKQCCHLLFITSKKHDFQNDYIIMDYCAAMRELCDYVFDEKKYDSLGYIGGCYIEDGIEIGKHRLSQFGKLLNDKGKYHDEFFKWEMEISIDAGYRMANELVESGKMPRAILVGNEEIAKGVLQAFEEKNISLENDVELILYKDIETLMLDLSKFTCLWSFPNFMWETAIKMLLERAEGKRDYLMTVLLPSVLKRK
ncbi:MAG: LacI family DNA-binding transcriptional regulator [Clostridia bacterium]